MKEKLVKLWSNFTMQIKSLSTCRRLQVGCILTSIDGERVLAYGYNGNYRGGPNTCDSNIPGYCGCIHAENNALSKSRTLESFVAFISITPCLYCAKLLLNAKVEKVYVQGYYRDQSGAELLINNGVEVIHVRL